MKKIILTSESLEEFVNKNKKINESSELVSTDIKIKEKTKNTTEDEYTQLLKDLK